MRLIYASRKGGAPLRMGMKDICRQTAANLNASAGDHRAMHWDCVKQSRGEVT